MNSLLLLVLCLATCGHSARVKNKDPSASVLNTLANVPVAQATSNLDELPVTAEEVPGANFKREVRFIDSNLGSQASLSVGLGAGSSSGGSSPDQLSLALEQLKTDIIAKSRDLREEISWVAEVKTILESYNTKVTRVEADIETTRTAIKGMLKKRRQIENLILQEQLQKRLKDAKTDLDTLDGALQGVSSKQAAFNQNKEDVEATIKALEGQLDVLKGSGGGDAGGEADKK